MSKFHNEEVNQRPPSPTRRKILQVLSLLGMTVFTGGVSKFAENLITASNKTENPQGAETLSRQSQLIRFLAEQSAVRDYDRGASPLVPEIALAQVELLNDFLLTDSVDRCILDIEVNGEKNSFVITRRGFSDAPMLPPEPETSQVQLTSWQAGVTPLYELTVLNTGADNPFFTAFQEIFGDLEEGTADGVSAENVTFDQLQAFVNSISPEKLDQMLASQSKIFTHLELSTPWQDVSSPLHEVYEQTMVDLLGKLLNANSENLEYLQDQTPQQIASNVWLSFSSPDDTSLQTQEDSALPPMTQQTTLSLVYPETDHELQLHFQSAQEIVRVQTVESPEKTENYYLSTPPSLAESRAFLREVSKTIQILALEACLPQPIAPPSQLA